MKGITLIYVGVIVVSIGVGTGLGLWSSARLMSPTRESSQQSQAEIEERKIREVLLTTGQLPASKLKLALDRQQEGWLVQIKAAMDDGLLASSLQTAGSLLRTLGRVDAPIHQVELIMHTSAVRDVYGQALKDLEIVRIVLSASTWDKVDWFGFDPRNFATVADVYWLHPFLEKQPLPPPRPDNAAMLGNTKDQ